MAAETNVRVWKLQDLPLRVSVWVAQTKPTNKAVRRSRSHPTQPLRGSRMLSPEQHQHQHHGKRTRTVPETPALALQHAGTLYDFIGCKLVRGRNALDV